MNERKTVRKWFWIWDFEKEERWLNEMAMEGWTLAEVGFCRFTFEKTEPGAYIVRTEMHGEDEEYLRFLEELGAEYVGRVVQWIYIRRPAEEGPFELFSDIDSRIRYLDRIGKVLLIIGIANLLIGVMNSLNFGGLGVINLLCATLLMYALGRIRGKKDQLEQERQFHE